MNKIRIGLEVHITLKTVSKLFSPAPQTTFALPNMSTHLIDWGYPGALPQVNLQAIKLAYQLGHLLHCQLDDLVVFDRKHYYYFDLPKGYQITQYFRPLAKRGMIELFLPNNVWKSIPIITAHLEEDTAQTLYRQDLLLINYNRAGNSLVEVTTEPVFENFIQVKTFLEALIRLLKKHDLSQASLTNGSMRVDVNISSKVDAKKNWWHPRNEIKNLNNFSNIKKAIEQEVIIQQTNFDRQNAAFHQSWTKKFAESTQSLKLMRRKRSQNEYMFIRENNLLPIALSAQQQTKWLGELKPQLRDEEYIRLYQLNFEQAHFLFRYRLEHWLEQLFKHKINLQLIFQFFRQIILPWRELLKPFEKQPVFLQTAVNLLQSYQHQPFSWKHFQTLFFRCLKTPHLDWKKELAILLAPAFVDLATTKQAVRAVLKQDPQFAIRYQKNPRATLSFLIGQVMKSSSKQFDPRQVKKLLEQALKQ